MIDRDSMDVTFCGLIRFPDLFKKSIEDAVFLRKERVVNKLIFSTWDYEINKYEGMRRFLSERDVILVESKEPMDRGIGNIWCQMISLDIGLDRSERGRFVLKTRPDVYINPDFIRKINSERGDLLKIKKSLPNGNVFRHKIWILYYELTKPFYIADECFLGERDDLKLLVNYERSYDGNKFRLDHGIPHIRRFIQPFLKKYPFLISAIGRNDKSMIAKTKYWKDIRRLNLYRYKIIRRILVKRKLRQFKKGVFNDEDYLKALAAYYAIIYSHFYIDSSDMQKIIDFRGHTTNKMKTYPGRIEKNFNVYNLFSKGNQIFLYDDLLIKNLNENKVENTLLSRKIIGAIDKFMNNKIY